MKKNWNSPELKELTIKATEKNDFNGCNGGNEMSPDEFHPERFVSGAITATSIPTFTPGMPGNQGGHGGHGGKH